MIDRNTLAGKIEEFLSAKVTKDQIYEWALLTAMSEGYEQISRQDPLINYSMQAILNLNRHDQKDIDHETKLKYFHECLIGNRVYNPAEAQALETRKPAKVEAPSIAEKILSGGKSEQGFN